MIGLIAEAQQRWYDVNVDEIDSSEVRYLLEVANLRLFTDYFQAENLGHRIARKCKKEAWKQLEGEARQMLGVNYWSHSQYHQSIGQLNRARDIFLQVRDFRGIAEVNNTTGLLHYYQARYDTAISYLKKSLNWYLSVKDSSQISRVSNNLGLLYDSKGEFEKSTHYLTQGIKYKVLYSSLRDQQTGTRRKDAINGNVEVVDQLWYERRSKLKDAITKGDTFQIAEAYSEMGKLLQLKKEHDSAIHYFEKAKTWFEYAESEGSVGLEWNDIGRSYSERQLYAQAIDCYARATPLLQKHYMFPSLGSANGSLAYAAFQLGNFEQARKHYGAGLLLSDSLGHPASLAHNLQWIASCEIEMKNLNEALRFAQRAYDTAHEIGSFQRIRKACEQLSTIYKSLDQPDKALGYLEEWTALTEKMNQALADRSYHEFQAKFENQLIADRVENLQRANKSAALALSYQRRAIVLGAVIFVLVVAFAMVLYTRFRKIDKLTRELDQQNQLLKNRNLENETLLKEIHHRVKNNLQMISSMISMQNRRVFDTQVENTLLLTQNRIKSIGLIHEHLYQSSSLSKVRLDTYVDGLFQLLLRSVAPGEKPKVDLVTEELETSIDLAISVGLILHELVSNSLKYAFDGSEEPVISLEMASNPQEIYIKYADNGVGSNSFKKGFGWSIIDATTSALGGEMAVKTNGGFSVSLMLSKDQETLKMQPVSE
ncbi:MAG: tetratricopeptide repeat protein [Cyclobacteriaceae bacterium]|nr:tetratricopeptide repeat protein [Cyclobacteriaceae bacterium HetDA_MAG_MS6]